MMTTKRQEHPGQDGVTLIEMIIVVSILMILAALVYPNYMERALRAKRVDAKSSLMTAAAEQEKFFMKNNRFATTPAELGVTETDQKLYTLTVASNSDTEFLVTASADPLKSQGHDDDCAAFAIDQLGRRTAADSSSSDNSEYCWR